MAAKTTDKLINANTYRYLHERNAVMDRYSEVTRESGHLEIALSAS